MIIASKYEVIGELGRGGMGVVYKVRHLELGAVFALKTLHLDCTEEAEPVGRFYHEARVMAQLSHPNIVKVFDTGKEGDCHYFVMEYIQGRSLNEILAQEGSLPLPRVLAISQQIGQALAYAHAQQPTVIHRDIKPHNIMLEDGTDRVVVMDFGIAKLLGQQQTQYTRTGLFIGTLMYGAPEQLRSDMTVDGRADIFSFGLVIYEMATGRRFFAGLTQEEIIGRQLYDPQEYVPYFERSLPATFRRLVAKAVAKNRDRRYATVTELLDALAKVPDSEGERAVFRPSRRLLIGGAALAGLVALVVIGRYGESPGFVEFTPSITPLTGSTEPTGLPKPTEPDKPMESTQSTEPLETAELNQPALPAQPVESSQPTEPAGPPAATVEHTGDVKAPTPPLIQPLRAIPAAGQVMVKACETQTFAVQGNSPQRYTWWVDGQRQQEEEQQLRFVRQQPGKHDVRVAVLGDDTASLAWEVFVTAVPPTEAQVQQWLADYQHALEAKAIGKLRTLGYVRTGQQAKALREKLRERQNYRVQIQNWQAEVHNSEVKLNFEQIDRWHDGAAHSLAVDYKVQSSQSVVLVRQDCNQIVAR